MRGRNAKSAGGSNGRSGCGAVTERRFDEGFRGEFAELLAWRRDVRRFRPGAVPEATLELLFGLTAFAPSVGNCQPARFVRVDEEAPPRGGPRKFRGRQPPGAHRLLRRAGKALRDLKLAGLREAPVHLAVFCDEATEQGHGLGARTMPETRRYSAVCALHTFWLAARAYGPRRRLGVDPRSGSCSPRRSSSARLVVRRLSLRRLAARKARHAGTRARRLAGPHAASRDQAVKFGPTGAAKRREEDCLDRRNRSGPPIRPDHAFRDG